MIQTTSKLKKPRGGTKKSFVNTPEKRSHESYRYLDIYPDILSMETRGASQEFIDRLGHDLLLWAQLKTSLVLRDFFDERYISLGTYTRWKNKDSMFAERVELAKGIIGSRREKGALEKRFDASMVIKSMANYDVDWKAIEEWRAKLSKAELEVEQLKVLIETFKTGEKPNEEYAVAPLEEV